MTKTELPRTSVPKSTDHPILEKKKKRIHNMSPKNQNLHSQCKWLLLHRPFKSLLHNMRSGIVFHSIKNWNISKSNLNETDPYTICVYSSLCSFSFAIITDHNKSQSFCKIAVKNVSKCFHEADLWRESEESSSLSWQWSSQASPWQRTRPPGPRVLKVIL